MHTGNIPAGNRCAFSKSVYPCAYREHFFISLAIYLKFGLSLCIQGTYPLHEGQYESPRFIPVHTGNIIKNDGFWPDLTVYPCAYREHDRALKKASLGGGLSLCIQGTLRILGLAHI